MERSYVGKHNMFRELPRIQRCSLRFYKEEYYGYLCAGYLINRVFSGRGNSSFEANSFQLISRETVDNRGERLDPVLIRVDQRSRHSKII